MAQIWFITKDGNATEIKNYLSIKKSIRGYEVTTGENILEIFPKERQAKEFIENLLTGLDNIRVCYQRD